ncbi:hypothetical protein J6590_016469 [Homalodisca vitripennis]|nr:hypothetical protein J6590_016469 [Homalodisca vitripennis]
MDRGKAYSMTEEQPSSENVAEAMRMRPRTTSRGKAYSMTEEQPSSENVAEAMRVRPRTTRRGKAYSMTEEQPSSENVAEGLQGSIMLQQIITRGKAYSMTEEQPSSENVAEAMRRGKAYSMTEEQPSSENVAEGLQGSIMLQQIITVNQLKQLLLVAREAQAHPVTEEQSTLNDPACSKLACLPRVKGLSAPPVGTGVVDMLQANLVIEAYYFVGKNFFCMKSVCLTAGHLENKMRYRLEMLQASNLNEDCYAAPTYSHIYSMLAHAQFFDYGLFIVRGARCAVVCACSRHIGLDRYLHLLSTRLRPHCFFVQCNHSFRKIRLNKENFALSKAAYHLLVTGPQGTGETAQGLAGQAMTASRLLTPVILIATIVLSCRDSKRIVTESSIEIELIPIWAAILDVMVVRAHVTNPIRRRHRRWRPLTLGGIDHCEIVSVSATVTRSLRCFAKPTKRQIRLWTLTFSGIHHSETVLVSATLTRSLRCFAKPT